MKFNKIPVTYSLAFETASEVLMNLPEIYPHDPDKISEGSEQSLGQIANNFEKQTTEYREYLDPYDLESQATDMITNALHWAGSQDLEVIRILRRAIAHFYYENNHEL